MTVLSKIDMLSLERLINSEYIHFIKRVYELSLIAGAESLGVTSAMLESLHDHLKTLIAILDSSHASEQTVLMHELDKKRDELIVYLLADIRTACKSPVELQRRVAEPLYMTTKPYIGIQRSAMSQKTSHIYSLQNHLEESPASVYLATLGLTVVLTELIEVNNKYDELSKERSEAIAERDIGNSTEVRMKSDYDYQYLVSMAGAAVLMMPSDEVTKFVESMNILIKDTKTAYNQRIAQYKAHEDDESAEEII